jgi:hypothetical protein
MNPSEKIKKEAMEKKKEADDAYARSDLNRLELNKQLENYYKKKGDKLTQEAIALLRRSKILEKSEKYASEEHKKQVAHNLRRASQDPEFAREFQRNLEQARKSRKSKPSRSPRSGTIKRGKEKMSTEGIKLEELPSTKPPREIIADLSPGEIQQEELTPEQLTPEQLKELEDLELELKLEELTPGEIQQEELTPEQLTPEQLKELEDLELELELKHLEKDIGGPSGTSEADKLLHQGSYLREMMDDSNKRLQESNEMLKKQKQEIYELNKQAEKLSKETGIPYDGTAVINELERRSNTSELQVCSPRPLGRPPVDNLTKLKLYIKSLLASLGCTWGGERKTRKYKKYKNKTKKYKKDKKHKRDKRNKKHTNKHYKKHKKHKRHTKKN